MPRPRPLPTFSVLGFHEYVCIERLPRDVSLVSLPSIPAPAGKSDQSLSVSLFESPVFNGSTSLPCSPPPHSLLPLYHHR